MFGFFDHLPPSVDTFYLINVDKKSTFLDYLSTVVKLIYPPLLVVCERPPEEKPKHVAQADTYLVP